MGKIPGKDFWNSRQGGSDQVSNQNFIVSENMTDYSN
jgi:hypothetical protein